MNSGVAFVTAVAVFRSAEAGGAQSEAPSPQRDIAAAPGVSSVTRSCECSENRAAASPGSVSIGGGPSAPREPSRLRAPRATCPPRSAARAAVAVAVGGAATATIVLRPRSSPARRAAAAPPHLLGESPFLLLLVIHVERCSACLILNGSVGKRESAQG